MKTGKRVTNAVQEAVLPLIHDVQISDAAGKILAVVTYPEMKQKAVASGEAAKWRISDINGGLLFSGEIGDGVTLDRTDIQYGGTVSLGAIEIV